MVAGSEHGQNIYSCFLCQCKSLKLPLPKLKVLLSHICIANSPINMQAFYKRINTMQVVLLAYTYIFNEQLTKGREIAYLPTVGLQAEECIHHSTSSDGEHY